MYIICVCILTGDATMPEFLKASFMLVGPWLSIPCTIKYLIQMKTSKKRT